MFIVLLMFKINKRKKYVLFLLVFICSFIPTGDLFLIGYIKVITGDLSITTIILLIFGLYIMLHNKKELYEKYNITAFMIIICVIGVIFYPTTLGLTYFDPYILGYQNFYMTLFLFFIAIVMVIKNLNLIALSIILAIFAHSCHILNSSNLWDYCIDFPLFLYSIGFLFVKLINNHTCKTWALLK